LIKKIETLKKVLCHVASEPMNCKWNTC